MPERRHCYGGTPRHPHNSTCVRPSVRGTRVVWTIAWLQQKQKHVAERCAKPCSSCRGTKAASGCEATVKPESGIYLNDRSVRFYDCYAAGRSLRSSAAATGAAHTRTNQAGRSAASRRSAFDLPAPSGGRMEVLRSGPTGMVAGRAVMGHG